jgi:hypothetical protein
VVRLQYAVDVEPVPPFAIGKVPVTLVVSEQYVVEVEPVPPLAIANVPPTVTAPVVAVLGVNPVDPKVIDDTLVVPALEANNFTVPELFLKYNFSSTVLSASSPATRSPAAGEAEAVVL